MANQSIYAAFERMWQHIVYKLSEKVNAEDIITDEEVDELWEEVLNETNS